MSLKTKCVKFTCGCIELAVGPDPAEKCWKHGAAVDEDIAPHGVGAWRAMPLQVECMVNEDIAPTGLPAGRQVECPEGFPVEVRITNNQCDKKQLCPSKYKECRYR